MRGGGKGERRKLSTHRSVRTPRGGASSQSGTPHPITPPCLPSTPGQSSSTHSHTDLQFIYRPRSYRYQLSSEKLSRPTASIAYYKDKSKLAGRRSQKVWNNINEHLSKDKTQGEVSQFISVQENTGTCPKAFGDFLVSTGEKVDNKKQKSGKHIVYLSTRTVLHGFTFLEVQQEQVITAISALQ